MGETETLEVEAEELSDEVIESLVEEGGINRNTAEELGDEVWFKEVDVAEPNKTSAGTYLEDRYNGFKSICSETWDLFSNYKTTYGEIKSVERSSKEHVRIFFKHERIGRRSVKFDKDSVKLANLMEYHGVENPKDLEGYKVLLESQKLRKGYSRLIVPHNVSFTGKLRFKMYSIVQELRAKTMSKTIYEDLGNGIDLMMALSIPALMLGMFGILVYSVSPLVGSLIASPSILWIVSFVSLILYGLVRVILLVPEVILRSDFDTCD